MSVRPLEEPEIELNADAKKAETNPGPTATTKNKSRPVRILSRNHTDTTLIRLSLSRIERDIDEPRSSSRSMWPASKTVMDR